MAETLLDEINDVIPEIVSELDIVPRDAPSMGLGSAAIEMIVQNGDYLSEEISVQEIEELAGTFLTDDPVRDWLNAIAKTPLLTKADEVRLSRQIEAGLVAEQVLVGSKEFGVYDDSDRDDLKEIIRQGVEAKDQMIRANLRLVVSVARTRGSRSRVDLLDRIQEGNMGLIRAVEKFDYAKGYKFSTYATWWIKQSVDRGIGYADRTIRLPNHIHEKIRKVQTARHRFFMNSGGVEPTNAELAEDAGLTEGEIKQLLRYDDDTTPMSYNVPLGDDGAELQDVMPQQIIVGGEADAIDSSILRIIIEQALSMLSPAEREILVRRFGLDDDGSTPLKDIAISLGVSPERIRQIQRRAEEKIRKSGVLELPL